MFPARYLDRGLLDEGAMGEIHQVYDQHMQRIVAMKVLKCSVLSHAELLRRFQDEALVTAKLQHPTIVPVHDRGVLDDGRPWFTMMVIHGESFEDRLELGPRGDPELWLRRSIDALRAVSQGVAYAHELDVLHRDIKPANIRIGSLGRVYLLDWGIARVRELLEAPTTWDGSTDPDHDPGDISGTVAGVSIGTWGYMAPEQAQGRPREHGGWSDVFSLGAVLFHILTGAPPYLSSSQARRAQPPSLMETLRRQGRAAPRDLVVLCQRCLAPLYGERPDALGVAGALQRWLDGEVRREEALALVDQAKTSLLVAARARAQQPPIRLAIAAEAQTIKTWAPRSTKETKRRLERTLEALDSRALTAELRAEHTLQLALRTAPELIQARTALADLFQQLLIRAEREERALDIQRYTELLRENGLVQHLDWLDDPGRLTLHTDPPSATVTAWRLVEGDFQLEEEHAGVLGTTPLDAHPLPPGSYVLVLERAGHHPVRYPVRVRRGEHWDGRPPGWERPSPVPLPPLGELAEDERYVPAGWFICGSDAPGIDPLPRRRLWVDGFIVSRDPVTMGEYVDFLNHLGPADAEAQRLPLSQRDNSNFLAPVVRRADGRFILEGDDSDQACFPAGRVNLSNCIAYLDWVSERRSQRLRLLHEIEWEKAARGVDERRFPWGPQLEFTLTNILGSLVGIPRICAVDDIPEDLSPYRVRGMGGNVRDLCANTFHSPVPDDGGRLDPLDCPAGTHQVSRGGGFNGAVSFSKVTDRCGSPAHVRFMAVCFRRARSWGGRAALRG